MRYFVFSRKLGTDGVTFNKVFYTGISKAEAVDSFKTAMQSYFDIISLAGNLYFVGFEDSPFFAELAKEGLSDRARINIILQNLGLAVCLNTLNTSGYKPRFTAVHDCTVCGKSNTTVQKNAYGDYLCADCWAAYAGSPEGLVEYYINIASGLFTKKSFSNDDLAIIEGCWDTFKDKLDRTAEEIALIEANYARAILPSYSGEVEVINN